jgi:hypothetical protein
VQMDEKQSDVGGGQRVNDGSAKANSHRLARIGYRPRG